MNYKKKLAPLALAIVLGATTAGTVLASDDIIVDEYIDIPTLQEEIVTAQPEASMVWVPGYWERDADQWNWVSGLWFAPPAEDAMWVNGHWKYESDKWHWVEGQWVVNETDWIVTDIVEVPDTIFEIQPEQPSTANHWVSGYWDWDGGWSWVSGYWTAKPDLNAIWVPGHWEPYGLNNGFWWMTGHWTVK